MRITVAIACYNLEDRIADCLKSVIAQDFPDIEILIIDDHSTDNSVEVVRKLIKNHSEKEIRLLINEENLGLCKVRNLSIDEAQGDAVFFMDGDDTIESGTLSLFHKRMEETGVDVVCGSFRKTDYAGNTLISKQFPDDTIKGNFAFASYIEKHIKGFYWLPIWNNLYRLDFLRFHNICCASHYRKHEGSLFTFKVALYAQGVSYIHDVTYNWQNVPTSITNGIKNNKNFLGDFRAVIKSVIDAKNEFESCHSHMQLPDGIRFLSNYIILTQGLLKWGLESETIGKKEKILFLKWLRRYYRMNNMNWSNIVGHYNRISYLILMSPFPYPLFRLYFRHLKVVSNIVNYFAK